jgi:hypothetical protein
MAEPGREHPALPEDLVNFHSDPVACAVAIGWPGAVVEEPHLLPVLDAGVPRFEADNTGRPTRVVTRFDGEAAI